MPKPWVLRVCLGELGEVREGDSRYDGTPPEEDRKEEAERPHVPAQKREALIKRTRRGGQSESERASSVKRLIF